MKDFDALRLQYSIEMLVEAKMKHCGNEDKKVCRACELFATCKRVAEQNALLQPEVLALTELIKKHRHKCRSCKNYEHVNQKEYFCHAFGEILYFEANEFESCFHFNPKTETPNND